MKDRAADSGPDNENSGSSADSDLSNVLTREQVVEVISSARVLSGKKFDAAVGNPPYQIETGSRENGNPTFSSVFPDFQITSSGLATKTSLVYPASWQSSLQKGLGKFLIDNGLVKSDTFYGGELFGNSIRDNYSISIVSCKKDYNGEIFINGVSSNRNSIVYLDSLRKKIFHDRTLSHKKMTDAATDLTNLKNIELAKNIRFSELKTEEKDVSIYIKRKSGTQADAGIFYISRKDASSVLSSESTIDRYKVAIPAVPFKQSRIFKEILDEKKPSVHFFPKIFKNKEIFSNTYVLIKEFDSLEEAENFLDYFNTKLSVNLFCLTVNKKDFGSFVPDLEDYTNNNSLFTSDDILPVNHEYIGLTLDERLYKYFDLTDEEINIVKSRE